MAEESGVIEEIRSVDFNSTPLWSFRLGEDLTWYRIGKTTPDDAGVTIGSHITFEHRNLQVTVPSIKRIESRSVAPPAPERTVPAATPSARRGSPTESTNTDLSRRIQWQAARRDACNIIVAAIKAEGYDTKGILPWAANVAKAKKLDLLRGYITQLTEQFIEEENNE
jgi:hypothetical protein